MTKGMCGAFGEQYVPETLMIALEELENVYKQVKDGVDFQQELQFYLEEYANRPSLLYYAEKMSEESGGAKIYLKREDLNHTGARKIDNVLGQALLVKQVGETKVIAETSAKQHGVVSATTAALFGMECEVFMGIEDMRRQSLNVLKMELLGITITGISSGAGTLKDACNEAMYAWASRCDDTFHILGSAVGPRPYLMTVRGFQKVISEEVKTQYLEKERHLPGAVITCADGGSNTIGTFYDSLRDENVVLIGCEATGKGAHTEQHIATIARGSVGVLHGMESLFLQDNDGQIMSVYSISVGLDYPGTGSEHADLAQSGRVQYVPVTDDEVVAVLLHLTEAKDIIPVIESSHALTYAVKLVPTMSRDSTLVVTLSRCSDKDIKSIAEYLEMDIHEQN